MHGAAVVLLGGLVLGDRADDDRGVVELPGQGVVAVDVEDIGDDAGDVVRAAAAQSELDQLLDGLLGTLVTGEGLFHRLVGDDAGETVGADQIAVAGPDLTDGEIGFDVVATAQRTHQESALRVGGGLFLGDPALVDQPLHPGVVLGDLGEYAVTQQVRAGVADVDEAEALAGPEQGGERGAHALQLGVLLDHHAQLVIGPLDRRTERSEDVRARDVVVELDERGDHLGAGDLTGRLAAHAVGDGEKARTGVAGVLVALSDHALVRSGGEAQGKTHAHLTRRLGVQPVSSHTAHPPVGSRAGSVARAVAARSLRSLIVVLLPQLDDGLADPDRRAQRNRRRGGESGPVEICAVGGPEILDDPLSVTVGVDPGMPAGRVVVVQHDR